LEAGSEACHDRRDDEEVAAVVLPGGAVPVAEIRAPIGSALPLDLLSLSESERFHELWHWWHGLSKTDAEVLSGRAISSSEASYGPPYRHPHKSWGIDLNYVGTPETWRRFLLRKNQRALCVLTRPSSVRGRRSCCLSSLRG